MNKIKLMYDVITKAREKKPVRGEVKAVGVRDEEAVFELQNLFEKNWQTGLMKAQIRAEWEYGGHKVKHESTTEFSDQGAGDRFHQLRGPMYTHHPHGCGNEQECGGFRRPLNRLAFFLHLLNNLQAEEQEDGYVNLTLDLTDIPEFMQKELRMKLDEQQNIQRNTGGWCEVKMLLTVEKPQIVVQARVDPERQIESILLTMKGEQIDETGTGHVTDLRVEVNCSW